jgi:hypothetical protein
MRNAVFPTPNYRQHAIYYGTVHYSEQIFRNKFRPNLPLLCSSNANHISITAFTTHDLANSAILYSVPLETHRSSNNGPETTKQRTKRRDPGLHYGEHVVQSHLMSFYRSSLKSHRHISFTSHYFLIMMDVSRSPVTNHATRSVLFRWGSHSPPGVLVNNIELQCRFHFVHFYMRLFAAHSKLFPLRTIHSVVIRIYINILHICWKRLEYKTRTIVTNFQSFSAGFI